MGDGAAELAEGWGQHDHLSLTWDASGVKNLFDITLQVDQRIIEGQTYSQERLLFVFPSNSKKSIASVNFLKRHHL